MYLIILGVAPDSAAAGCYGQLEVSIVCGFVGIAKL
jgi:hypothetical protein